MLLVVVAGIVEKRGSNGEVVGREGETHTHTETKTDTESHVQKDEERQKGHLAIRSTTLQLFEAR